MISDTDVTSVWLQLNDQILCHAAYGLPSPDIAERYPHYPHADHAGFSFSTRLAEELEPSADTILTLRVRTAGGHEASRAVPVELAAEAAPVLAPRSPSDPWPIRIALEEARPGWRAASCG